MQPSLVFGSLAATALRSARVRAVQGLQGVCDARHGNDEKPFNAHPQRPPAQLLVALELRASMVIQRNT